MPAVTYARARSGTRVVFMKRLLVKDKSPDASRTTCSRFRCCANTTVFNVAQCDGLPERIINGPTVVRMRNPDTRDELADAFVATTGADVRDGHGQAMYIPSLDYIGMPKFEDFKGADHFYNTLLHELTHWTAHENRCDRNLARDGSATRLMPPRSWLPSSAPRSCAPSLLSTVSARTRATSRTGSSC